jgi:iron complex outermembrane recepter protein
VQGVLGAFDLDFGVRRTESKLIETGRGFVVRGLATAAINDGSYDVDDPFSNTPELLGSITTTTGRDSVFQQSEIYASATTDLFKMGGGSAKLYIGAEARKEKYADLYDSLSESGQVLGSSGSSAAGEREVSAFTAEAVFPITKGLEASLAGRYEHYSDYGSDFSPKVSVAFKPMRELTFRAAAGKGFRAPSLPDLNQKPAFSADSIVDLRHCQVENPGWTEEECAGFEQQINGLRIANPTLTSEKSTQYSFGVVWDVTPALSVKADYWNTKIDDAISFVSAQQIVDRDNGDSALPIPDGLSIRRDPVTGQILQIVSGSANEGVWHFSGIDLNVLFQHKYGGFGAFRHELSYSPLFEAKVNSVEQKGTFGTPEERATLSNGWKISDFDFTWNINYIGKNGSKADGNYTGGYVTHDVQLAWAPSFVKGSKVTVGAVNVTEKFPALVGSPYDQKPFNYYLYDAYGAQYYLRVEQKF